MIIAVNKIKQVSLIFVCVEEEENILDPLQVRVKNVLKDVWAKIQNEKWAYEELGEVHNGHREKWCQDHKADKCSTDC